MNFNSSPYQSCSRCRSGIMEPLYKISFENGFPKRELYVPNSTDLGTGDILVVVCSLDECGNTEMLSAPGTVTEFKNEQKKQYYGSIRLFS